MTSVILICWDEISKLNRRHPRVFHVLFPAATSSEYSPAGGNGSDTSVGDEISFTLTIENNGTLTLSTVMPVISKVKRLTYYWGEDTCGSNCAVSLTVAIIRGRRKNPCAGNPCFVGSMPA